MPVGVGGPNTEYWNFAEFLENFIANFGYNPFYGDNATFSEGDIPNVDQPNPDDVWENLDPTIKQFMVLFSKYVEGLDSDDTDRINRQNEANRWLDQYNKYKNDEITLDELKSFESEELSGMDGWDDFFTETIGNEDLGGGDDDDEDQDFADYVEEVGEGVANTAKGLYDELKDKITDCVGSPIDCIKQIGTAILESGGISEECTRMPNGGTTCGTAENPTRCWKDCVSFNLPGLPIPDIPLPPGVVDVGTYRDFENAVKTVGKTIGDIIDGNEACGPDGDQECTIGQVLEDLGEWARRKWEEAIGGIDDATGQDVLDWLKGILGPVTAGIIWAEIEEEVTNMLTPLDPETKDCTDGSGQVYATVGINEDCPPVPCLEGEKDFGNGCEPVCEYDESIPASNPQCEAPLTETEEQCNAQGKVYDELNDQCKEECKNPEYVISADGNCGPPEEDPDDDTDDGTDVDCNSPRPSFDGSTDSQYAQKAWTQLCGGTNCPQDGSLISDHPNNDCNIPIGDDAGNEECANGAIAPDCVQCPGYNTVPAWHEGGDCRNPVTYAGESCGENGEVYDDAGNCVDPEVTGDCPDGSEPQYDANDPNKIGVTKISGMYFKYDPCNPDGGVTEVFLCRDGSFEENKEDCPAAPVDCSDDPNSEPDGQGGCRCKDGFEPDPESGLCKKPPADCSDPNTVPDGQGGCECKDGLITDPETGYCLTKAQFCALYQDNEICAEPPPVCDNPNATNNGQEGECVFDECANGATDPEAGCVTCPAGMKMGTTEDGVEACVDDGLSETCDNGKTVESGCQECPEGTVDDGEGGCQQVFVCDDPNATVVQGGPFAGACGPCKPGYVYDGGPERCVKDGCPEGQIENEDGSCSDIPIECPEGQEFCESTGTCEEPQNCPGGPDEGGGGGGGGTGGGGGGGSMFQPYSFAISADPQLLSRSEFPITDFLAGIFTNSRGGRNV